MRQFWTCLLAAAVLTGSVTAGAVAKPNPRSWRVEVFFTPAVVPAGYYVSMWAQTHPGANCYANVVYSTGYERYRSESRTADERGHAWWQWNDETGVSGKGTVTCTWRGVTRRDTDGYTTSFDP